MEALAPGLSTIRDRWPGSIGSHNSRNNCKSNCLMGVASMTANELRLHLEHLIDTYVPDQVAKAHLLALVARPNVPVKGILVELEPFLAGAISQADAKIVKDIAFHFN